MLVCCALAAQPASQLLQQSSHSFCTSLRKAALKTLVRIIYVLALSHVCVPLCAGQLRMQSRPPQQRTSAGVLSGAS